MRILVSRYTVIMVAPTFIPHFAYRVFQLTLFGRQSFAATITLEYENLIA
jgi:hypothetical protein